MAYDPRVHHRRSVRLRGYDYSRPGAYFVTICTAGRRNLFGAVADGSMHANRLGEIVRAAWADLGLHYHNVRLDSFVVMPNHVHGVLILTEEPTPPSAAGAAHRSASPHNTGNVHMPQNPTQPQTSPPETRFGLGTILRGFKSISGRRINQTRRTPGAAVWQRSFYEHIIRNPVELERIREYIAANPAEWPSDPDNPALHR